MTIVSSIQKNGATYVEPLLPCQVGEVMDHLRSCLIFPGCHVRHGAGPPTTWGHRKLTSVACWDMHDVIRAPHLLEHALQYTSTVAECLGVDVPMLYSINAFITQPGSPIRPDIQAWHRDADDTKFIPLFVFLTDVGDDGAQEVRIEDGRVSRMTGPAGTTFFSNTMLEHRGLKPQHSERIIWWARWGVSNPPASYVWDHLSAMDKDLLGDRYPDDPRLRRSLRLVVA